MKNKPIFALLSIAVSITSLIFLYFNTGLFTQNNNIEHDSIDPVEIPNTAKNSSKIRSNQDLFKSTKLTDEFGVKPRDQDFATYNSKTFEEREKLMLARQHALVVQDPLYMFRIKAMGNDYDMAQQQLLDALTHRNWQKVKELLYIFAGTEFEDLAFNAIFSSALSAGAPYDLIEELINLGASVPTNAMEMLAIFGHSELIGKLIPHGLDIHYVDSIGMNALSFIALYSMNKIAVNPLFEDLIDQGLETIPSDGLDVLNITLANIEKSDIALEYTRILLEAGVEMDNSHIQQLIKIKKNNQQAYKHIINLLPQLEVIDMKP